MCTWDIHILLINMGFFVFLFHSGSGVGILAVWFVAVINKCTFFLEELYSRITLCDDKIWGELGQTIQTSSQLSTECAFHFYHFLQVLLSVTVPERVAQSLGKQFGKLKFDALQSRNF